MNKVLAWAGGAGCGEAVVPWAPRRQPVKVYGGSFVTPEKVTSSSPR